STSRRRLDCGADPGAESSQVASLRSAWARSITGRWRPPASRPKGGGDMADPPTLGSRLRAIREGKALSVSEAAPLTRLTTSYLTYVEADEVVPSERFLLQITNAYRVDPHELLALREEARRAPED